MTQIQYKLIISCCLLLYILTSCHRQELEYEYSESVAIPIHVDWSASQLDPQNVTVFIYDTKDGRLIKNHRFANNNHPVQSYITLPVGNYTAVVFNELLNQVSGVEIVDYENYSTLKALLTEDNHVMVRDNSTRYVVEPEVLGAAVVTDLDVTEEMVLHSEKYSKLSDSNSLTNIKDIIYSTEALMHIVPKRKIGRCEVEIHVKNLNMSRHPILVDINNIAADYNFSTDKNGVVPASVQVAIDDFIFDAEDTHNGLIRGVTYNFGVFNNRLTIEDQPKALPLNLLLRFMLVNKERTIKTYRCNVSKEQISFIHEDNTSVTMHIRIDLDESLPEVKPEGSETQSGFDIGVIDWGVVDVPLVYE